jgi:hypothetical protein
MVNCSGPLDALPKYLAARGPDARSGDPSRETHAVPLIGTAKKKEGIMRKVPAIILSSAAAIGLSIVWAGEGAMPERMPVNATFQRMKSLVGDWKGPSKEGAPATTVSYTLVSHGSADGTSEADGTQRASRGDDLDVRA